MSEAMDISPASALEPRRHERSPSPVEPLDRHNAGVNKMRKSSTGGGRAWSEEEETYLLQTRMQKMPYKQIALHLRKTELACRLHYHQLCHGAGRRKRTVSVSSGSSVHSVALEPRTHSPERYASTAPTTPDQTSLRGSPVIKGPTVLMRPQTDSPDISQKPVLPRPTFITPQYGPKSAHSQPPPPARVPSRETLKLNCNVTFNRLTPIIDKDRLREIYDAHRVSFWKMIAAEYGQGISPTALEELWRSGGVHQAPLTPDEGNEVKQLGHTNTFPPSSASGPPPPPPPSAVLSAFSPVNAPNIYARRPSAPAAPEQESFRRHHSYSHASNHHHHPYQPRRMSVFALPPPSTTSMHPPPLSSTTTGTSSASPFSASSQTTPSIASLLNETKEIAVRH